MKQRILLLLLFAPLIYARSWEEQTLQWNLGPMFNYASYKLGCLPRIHGYLGGFHTDFTYRGDTVYTQLQFDGRWNAAVQCGDFDMKSKIRDYRPEWFLGFNFFPTGESFLLVDPLVGFGFYHLSKELLPDVMTYRYFNIYVPIGFDATWKVRSCEFDIGLRALYRIDAYTKAKLSTPCVEPCECKKIDLKRSHGVHVEMPFTWYKSWNRRGNFQLKVVPYFDWNRFGRADEANENGLCVELPQLDRWYLGARLDFGVRF